MEKVIKHTFAYQQVIEYFKNHIDCGNVLSRKILKEINFMKGEFFTRLNDSANVKHLLYFENGGILPSQDSFFENMENDLIFIINKYLTQSSTRIVILDNYNAKPGDKHFEIPNVELHNFNNEVYYTLNNHNSIAEIQKTVKKSDQLWHFLAVFSELDSGHTRVNLDWFNNICSNARLIVTSSYDGEGYIYWKKNKPEKSHNELRMEELEI